VARLTRHRTARITVLCICALALAGLFAGVVRQSWMTNAAANDVVRMESYGAEMLHPMTSLLANMVEAQSAAVRGEPVDATQLRKSLAGVAKVDLTRGELLQTHQRLADLTSQFEAALVRKPTGQDGYEVYSDLVTLTLNLIRQIGDTSHLAHDPDLDSYYVMEAAIVRLPNAVVLAGRAADLVVLSGGKALEGENAVRAAVARFGVSEAAEALNAGLTKSVNSTNRNELGSNIAERLDTFKAAADAFAPPTMLKNLAGEVDSQTLSANARRVYGAANPLAHLLLGELQALLDQRSADLTKQWRFTALAASGIGVIGIVTIWLLIAARQRGEQPENTGEVPGAHARLDNLPLGSLTYARELLDAEEMVHSGRTARPRAWGDGDAR
jgi:hypothetical protein